MNMDKGLVTGSVFIDLAKAFDTVDHDIYWLVHWSYYGVCDESLPWFKNYFSRRKQLVCIDSQTSEELEITSGVPQGSILGPMLFIVYINDLPHSLKHCSVNMANMYTDETAICLGSQTIGTLNFYLNQDLERLAEWLEDNNLVLNVAKTKSLLFTSQRHKERDCKLSLILLGREISWVTTFKYLGVVFDNFMTWKAHADYVCKKMAYRVSILGHIRGFLTKEMSILVYNPGLQYINSATVWLRLRTIFGNLRKVSHDLWRSSKYISWPPAVFILTSDIFVVICTRVTLFCTVLPFSALC